LKIVLLVALVASLAQPARAATLVAVVADAADDARKAVVIGAAGEVYEPDGQGAWVRRLPSSTADTLVAAGRAGRAIVASGNGVVYRLAANGWSAIRLVQRGKAVLGAGSRVLAAVGRQIYALDPLPQGEPIKLALAPANVVAMAAGAKAIIVSTDAGVFRIGGGKPAAIHAALQRPRLVSERWAIVDRGALELTTRKLTAWPGGLTIGAAVPAADGALVAVATGDAGLELLTLRGGTFARDPLGISGTAVGVVVDRARRAVVVLSDGRIALRDAAGWTTTQVTHELPAARPGAPPATAG
jgi:hypothetical protein